MCSVGLWGRSRVQGFRSEVSHIAFLGEAELGVPKLGHCCALKLWKGSSREPREDKEGIRIWVERPDRNQTAWEDSSCLAYRQRAKWIPGGSIICSPPTDHVQSDPGCCSSSSISREGEVSA